jgi:peptidoglycan/LPS O-acetylase OafA/YrhL
LTCTLPGNNVDLIHRKPAFISPRRDLLQTEELLEIQPKIVYNPSIDGGARIPTLDGWRGVAILLVLFDHFQYAVIGRYMLPWTRTGQHGVTLFFVLSGFLITSKLLQGPIDLKRFYVRRFFRLMPVAWAYLAAIVLFGFLVHQRITSTDAVLASLLFYRNFLWPEFGSSTWHFWSLSLEEQFYVVWPCLLALAGVRRCRWIAAAGVISCAIYRWMFWAHYNQDPLNCESQVRADALLVGTLMAMLLKDPSVRARASLWSKVWALPALVVLIYCIGHFSLLPPLVECVAIALLLTASVLHPDSFVTLPLRSWTLSQLGIVSYSVYVWQEVFMLLASGGGLKTIPLLGLFLPLCALGSYVYIERPSTRIGHRLTSTRRPTTKAAITAVIPQPRDS